MKFRLSVVAALLAIASTLTACGSASPGAGTDSGAAGSGGSGGTLIIGMTAANIPGLDTLQASSEGGEGTRFVTLQLYDGLTRWDLSQGKTAPKILPGLATSWSVAKDGVTWTFHLRKGVTFTDGTPWNADAAIFNIDRYVDKSSPQYDSALNAIGGLAISGIKSAKKVNDMTIDIVTNGPWAYLDEDLATMPFGSPTAIKTEGKDFANHPVGTGPFMFQSETRGQQLVLVKNPHYWRGAPKLDRLILRPIPDATARLAALESGEVNWIEVPSPDDITSLKSQGFQVLTNSYPHNWPWLFNMKSGPWKNPLVREAANYAIDRDSMSKDILQGTGEPAYQYLGPADPGYVAADNKYSYDPAKAKQLLAQAGYPNGFTTTLSYPTSGSGNMIPGPMNEALQQNLAAVGIKVKLEPIEWSAMLSSFYANKIPGGADAINISLGFSSMTLLSMVFHTGGTFNVGGYSDPKTDKLLDQLKVTYSASGRAAIMTQLNRVLLKDNPWLVVVHDLNPRALAPDVHGFVMPKSWYVDLTTTWVG